jgi:hypothetical protein
VDDDGDLILDEVDPSAAPGTVWVAAQLAELEQPANVNAGMRSSDIEAGLVKHGTLTVTAGVDDCSGLSWCPPSDGAPFHPQATSDQLRAGDLLIVGGVLTAVGSVSATVPAIASYTDDLGTHVLRYPLEPGTVLPLSGTVVRFELWRPQRRAMPADEVAEDEGRWVDMGGLAMSAGTAADAACPADAYSAADPVLLPYGPVLIDQAPDVPSGQGATFGYTLDVAKCLAASGQSFGPGEQATLLFTAGGAQSAYSFSNQP